MPRISAPGRSLSVIAALLASTALFAPALARAGTCPPEHVLTKPREIEDKDSVHVKRETLGIVKLQGWRQVGDLLLRTRMLTVQKGGVIPTHYHDDRPSIVFILKGETIEHNRLCAVPIRHKAGDVTEEFGPDAGHWWENVGDGELIFLSSDVIPPDMQDAPEMD